LALPREIIPVTAMGERPGSGTISFGKSGVSATRKWVVPWVDASGNDYITRVTQLLGLTIAGPGGMPAVTYPDVFSAEMPWLYCQEVDVEGEDCVGNDAWGRIQYRRAVLTAKYMPYDIGETFSLSAQSLSLQEGTYSFLGPLTVGPPPAFFTRGQDPSKVPDDLIPAFDDLSDPDADVRAKAQERIDNWKNKLAKANSRPGGEPDPDWVVQYQNWQAKAAQTVTSPGCADDYFNAHAAGTVGQPMTKVIPLGEYSLDRSQVLTPNFWAYIALMGSVNAFFFIGFPPWTLLFSGIEGKRAVLPNGTKIWDINFKFHFNPNSWNHLFRPEKGRWEVVASNGKAAQTYWSIEQAAKGQPPALVRAEDELHSWLYRPMDFAPVLLFS
jgi:hypothetical protein